MMASSDIDRASSAIDPPSNADAMASELRFWPHHMFDCLIDHGAGVAQIGGGFVRVFGH